MFSNDIVLSLLEYLDLNLFKKVSMDELSNYFHFNKDYLMRIFKREIHSTIIEYMNQKRVFLSLDALKGNSSILNIALCYGFTSQEYYCETFHKYIGVSPTVYRDYLNYRNTVTDDDISTIQSHYFNLTMFFKSINTYRNNLPPKENVLQYSIFK